MSGGGVKGPWNKWEGPTASCAVGGHPFMPRKPLMPTQRPTLRAAGGGLFYNPPPAASRRVRGLGQRPKVLLLFLSVILWLLSHRVINFMLRGLL